MTHFTLYTLYSKLYTPHSTLDTPTPALYTAHFTLHNFVPYTLHSTLYTVRFTVHTLHFKLCTFTLYTLHFTLDPHNFALFTLYAAWNLGLASFPCCTRARTYLSSSTSVSHCVASSRASVRCRRWTFESALITCHFVAMLAMLNFFILFV